MVSALDMAYHRSISRYYDLPAHSRHGSDRGMSARSRQDSLVVADRSLTHSRRHERPGASSRRSLIRQQHDYVPHSGDDPALPAHPRYKHSESVPSPSLSGTALRGDDTSHHSTTPVHWAPSESSTMIARYVYDPRRKLHDEMMGYGRSLPRCESRDCYEVTVGALREDTAMSRRTRSARDLGDVVALMCEPVSGMISACRANSNCSAVSKRDT